MSNIWIGPWANFPHYMDPTLQKMDPNIPVPYYIKKDGDLLELLRPPLKWIAMYNPSPCLGELSKVVSCKG